MNEKEWVAIAQKKVKETIKKTDKTIQKVDDCLSNLSKNPLLEPAELDRRLTALKDGYASNAIENNPLTQDEKIHLENMVKKGLTDDEMIQEIAKDMGLVEEVQESTKKEKSSLTKSLESAEKFLSEIRTRK